MGFFGEKKNSGVRGIIPEEERWLIDHWQDRARDQVPVLVEMDRKDRLKVEDVLGVVELADAKVRVVLKLYANQIGDWVLSCLAQITATLGESRGRCHQRCSRQNRNPHHRA